MARLAHSGVLNYVTPKYVVLSDGKLGLIYYVLLVLILSFTALELFFWKGYLEFDTNPHGFFRLVVSDELADPPSYDVDELSYCRHGNPSRLPCQYMDSQEMTWPWDSRAITVTTHAKDKWQRAVHHQITPPPPPPPLTTPQTDRTATDPAASDDDHNDDSVAELLEDVFEARGTTYGDVQVSEYLTVNPEYVLVKVDHTVVATKFTDASGVESLAHSHRQMLGHLYSSNGTKLRELNGKNQKPDKLTVKELLDASGLYDLEERSDYIANVNETYRQRGCVIRVSIAYDNWRKTWFGTHEIEYSYYVKRLPFIDYVIKEVQPVRDLHDSTDHRFSTSPEFRLQRKRYAIRIEFEQSGSLGRFSLVELVVKLASSVGLLTLTATFIEYLALYILPGRAEYRDQIIDSTLLERGELEKKRVEVKSS